MITDSPVVSYLGWHGKGNLGDDAIREAVVSQLPGALFVDAPHLPHERIRSFATGSNRLLRRSTQVVGGGTLVGRRQWRKSVSRGLAITQGKASYAIGVGVEDPAFSGLRSGSDAEELKRWVPILSELQIVSVRGPRSAALLSDIGVDVQVAGDPALLLPRPAVTAEDGLIGLNLGFGDDLWGHDPMTMTTEVTRAVRRLASEGHRFVGILMNPEDEYWTSLALQHVSAVIVRPADPRAAAYELARCSVAIVSRLHAGVLAALSDTPVVSLEYQPKCRDFALSIDNGAALIRADAVTSGAVVDHVHAAIEGSAASRPKTHRRVEELRGRLRAEYAVARDQLGIAEDVGS